MGLTLLPLSARSELRAGKQWNFSSQVITFICICQLLRDNYWMPYLINSLCSENTPVISVQDHIDSD